MAKQLLFIQLANVLESIRYSLPGELFTKFFFSLHIASSLFHFCSLSISISLFLPCTISVLLGCTHVSLKKEKTLSQIFVMFVFFFFLVFKMVCLRLSCFECLWFFAYRTRMHAYSGVFYFSITEQKEKKTKIMKIKQKKKRVVCFVLFVLLRFFFQ